MSYENCPICGKQNISVENNLTSCPVCGWVLIPLSYYKTEKQKGGILPWSGHKSKEEESENEIDLLRERWAREKWREIVYLNNQIKAEHESTPETVISRPIPIPSAPPLDDHKIKELIRAQLQINVPDLVEQSLKNLINSKSPLLTEFVQDLLDQVITQAQVQKKAEPTVNIDPISSPEINEYVPNIPPITPTINPATPQKSQPPLDSIELQIVQEYNNHNIIGFNYIEVAESEDSLNKRRTGFQQAPLLEQAKRGDYYIIKITNQSYLVPKIGFSLNEYSLKTLELLFNFENYQGVTRNFQLLKPAKVLLLSEQKWRLIEQGILKF